jgi:hypothetical protein
LKESILEIAKEINDEAGSNWNPTF